MKTFHIHIKGLVQGVGFRPFVYKLAAEHGLAGWVNNTTDGVHIEFNAEETKASQFRDDLLARAPVLSRITGCRMEERPFTPFDSFRIVHSDSAAAPDLVLTPDFALCDDCRREFRDPSDHRFGYPFITCINCGPRYSIVRKLPYDRERTTMSVFPMCPVCATEYNDPLDRRYYSQTNSCSICGVVLTLLDRSGRPLSTGADQPVLQAANAILEGRILAVKGIGGYLLVCDATNREAVAMLRQRKHRPSKPFALMYPDEAILEGDVQLGDDERKALRSPESPVLLLERKETLATGIDYEGIAPGLDQIGVMLPYTPLYDRLLQLVNCPVVATSGNLSNAPIVFQDEKAVRELIRIADYLLANNRDIVVPQDDSVIRFSSQARQRIVIRRSRGIAPSFIHSRIDWPGESILALGAELKSALSLLHRGNTYVSQYLGDLDSFDTQESFRHTLHHFLDLFSVCPDRVLVDRHPDYFATRLGRQLAREWEVPVGEVQHHMAHFAAVLAENDLLDHAEPVLGVIWDGTGLGDDGQIWGGEFFRYRSGRFGRCGQWSYFDFILGDKMPREPRISALAACYGAPGWEEALRPKFSPVEWEVYSQLLSKGSSLKTSSVGRIFDAVASLLGLMDKSSYEGEAAMLLEQAAARYFRENGWERINEPGYWNGVLTDPVLPTRELIAAILDDRRRGVPVPQIAARFHLSLVHAIGFMVKKEKVGSVAFSGGVFQNALIVDLMRALLEKDVKLYFHKQLSPNDEGISFGQLVFHRIDQLTEGK